MADHWLKRLFTLQRPEPPPPIEPGLYHTVHEGDATITRFHLRVERDGSGMLIANAAAAARLSPTGTVIAKGLLDGQSEDEVFKQLQARFQGVSEAVMKADIAQVNGLLEEILRPSDTYPVFNLEDATLSPFGAELIAPFQASVPLAPPAQLVPILDRLWEVGIPHVTLLAPEQPEAAHLIRAVERAEDLGMIAGVRARATDLSAEGLLDDLRAAGIDHITLPYAAPEAAVHDAFFGAGDHAAAHQLLDWLEEHEVCAVAEIPLVEATLPFLETTITTLMQAGADNLSFVAYATVDAALAERGDGALFADAMPQVATTVEEIADLTQARFLWEPPVERIPAQPLAKQLRQGPRCSGDVAVRIEADGRVIPPRGPQHSAGNLLTDRWDAIWNDAAFVRYRERVAAPTRCDICPGLTICAADCPRKPEGWARGATT